LRQLSGYLQFKQLELAQFSSKKPVQIKFRGAICLFGDPICGLRRQNPHSQACSDGHGDLPPRANRTPHSKTNPHPKALDFAQTKAYLVEPANPNSK
jgi:hypothetical protein